MWNTSPESASEDKAQKYVLASDAPVGASTRFKMDGCVINLLEAYTQQIKNHFVTI